MDSYKLDIVLRVVHEHFNKTKDANELPSTLLTQIFDNLADMLKESRWKSSNISHLAFLAFAFDYKNEELMKTIELKILE